MIHEPPAILAPGRVNLIGEHTDYSGGLVQPVAVDRGVTVRWRPDTDAIRLRSAAFPETVVELAADGTPPPGLAGVGSLRGRRRRAAGRAGRPAAGLDGTVSSTLPVGAGLWQVGVALADAGEAEAYIARTGRDGTGYVRATADAAG